MMCGLVDKKFDCLGMSQVTLPEGMTEDMALSVYQNYEFRRQYDEKLSIAKHRLEVSCVNVLGVLDDVWGSLVA